MKQEAQTQNGDGKKMNSKSIKNTDTGRFAQIFNDYYPSVASERQDSKSNLALGADFFFSLANFTVNFKSIFLHSRNV